MKKDWYDCFGQLQKSEREGIDFRVTAIGRDSGIAIVAPHGGEIEPHTSIIARAVAGDTLSLYLFEGLRPHREHCELHVTSEKFDEPTAAAIVASAEAVLGIHGRADKEDGETTWVGGLDFKRRDGVVASLIEADFAAVARKPGQSLAGAAPNNICNRGKSRAGIQLELPRSLRDQLSKDDDRLSRYALAILIGLGFGGGVDSA